MTDRARLASLLRLIVITDEALASRHGGVERVVAAALDAGCRAVQLRMKGAGARDMLSAAGPLRRMTAQAEALLFINDRLDVALAVGADGVHLGPDDLPVGPVRAAVDGMRQNRFLIGYSTDEPDAARRAAAEGADYIGCGTVFATGSKADAGEIIGLEGLDAVVRAVDVPVVAIGGITPERAMEVAAGTRASGTAVVSAVMGAESPRAATARLLEAFRDRAD